MSVHYKRRVSRAEVTNWEAIGRDNGARWVLVIQNDFEYFEHPIFVMPHHDLDKAKKCYVSNMSRVLETIDLS